MVYFAEPSLIQGTKAHCTCTHCTCTFKRKERFYDALKSANVEDDVLQLADDVFFLHERLPSKLYVQEEYKN